MFYKKGCPYENGTLFSGVISEYSMVMSLTYTLLFLV